MPKYVGIYKYEGTCSHHIELDAQDLDDAWEQMWRARPWLKGKGIDEIQIWRDPPKQNINRTNKKEKKFYGRGDTH